MEICSLPAAGRGATFFSLVDAPGYGRRNQRRSGLRWPCGHRLRPFRQNQSHGGGRFRDYDQLDGKGIAVGGKQGFNAFLSSGKGQIADINGNSHNDSVVEVGKLSA